MFFEVVDDQKTEWSAKPTYRDLLTHEDEARLKAALHKSGLASERTVQNQQSEFVSREDSAAICQALKIVERQLCEVNADVEVSVNGVCSGFGGMAERAQSAIRSAQDALGGRSGHHPRRDLISEMRSVLSALVENIRSSSDFSQSISRRLNDLELRFTAVAKAIQNIETIAQKVKFVAFNTRIEAVRLGDKGNALAVVARETAQLAGDAAESNDAIRNLVEILTAELRVTSKELKNRTELDANRVVDSEQSANELLDDIAQYNERISNSLSKTEEMTTEMRTDIANAVVNMQFQDRVSQRISHVVDIVREIAQKIRPSISDSEIEAVASSWLNHIMSRYTMDSERTAHNLDSTNSQPAGPTTHSVELF